MKGQSVKQLPWLVYSWVPSPMEIWFEAVVWPHECFFCVIQLLLHEKKGLLKSWEVHWVQVDQMILLHFDIWFVWGDRSRTRGMDGFNSFIQNKLSINWQAAWRGEAAGWEHGGSSGSVTKADWIIWQWVEVTARLNSRVWMWILYWASTNATCWLWVFIVVFMADIIYRKVRGTKVQEEKI